MKMPQEYDFFYLILHRQERRVFPVLNKLAAHSRSANHATSTSCFQKNILAHKIIKA